MNQTQKNSLSHIYTFTGGVLCLFVSFGIAYHYVIPDFLAAKKSENWKQTTGEVLKSEIVQKTQTNSINNKRVFRVQITYRYEINDTDYLGTYITIDPSKEWTEFRKAHQFVQKYSAGTFHNVYYDQFEAEKSALKPGLLVQHYLALAGNILFFVAGFFATLLSLISAVKKGLKKRKDAASSLPLEDVTAVEALPGTAYFKNHYTSPLETPWEFDWYVLDDLTKQKEGPLSFDDLATRYEKGRILPEQFCYPVDGQGKYKLVDIVHKNAKAS
jgi:hypothetical protein